MVEDTLKFWIFVEKSFNFGQEPPPIRFLFNFALARVGEREAGIEKSQ